MVLFPNAKINLGLNVVSRRPDGYHDIETVMMPVGWHDVLEIVPAQGQATTLTVTGRGVDCPPERNLVMRAYRAMAARCPEVGLADIYLHKVIPDGAGLGGGSADAAFTVVGLNDLFGAGLTPDELAAVAGTVGSDCPFFVFNRPMLCTGTGTDIVPYDLQGFPAGTLLAIVKPPQGVSTAVAYAGVTPRQACPPVREAAALPWTAWTDVLVNDFEPSVTAACPQVGAVRQALESLSPVYCSMSGSGSAVYALFGADNMSADLLLGDLARLCPECDIWVEGLGE